MWSIEDKNFIRMALLLAEEVERHHLRDQLNLKKIIFGSKPSITPNADLPGKLRMSDELNRLEEALACFDSLPLLNNMLYNYNHND